MWISEKSRWIIHPWTRRSILRLSSTWSTEPFRRNFPRQNPTSSAKRRSTGWIAREYFWREIWLWSSKTRGKIFSTNCTSIPVFFHFLKSCLFRAWQMLGKDQRKVLLVGWENLRSPPNLALRCVRTQEQFYVACSRPTPETNSRGSTSYVESSW